MASQDKSRRLVTYTDIPADRHIVGREGGIVIGRGQGAQKSAITKESSLPDKSTKQQIAKGAPVATVQNQADKAQGTANQAPASGADSAAATQTKPKPQVPKQNGKQKKGCLLLTIILAIFAIIVLVILVQNSSRMPDVPVDIGGIDDTSVTVVVGGETSEENFSSFTNFSGGDTETGMKLIFGLAGLISFLVVIFGALLFFTSGDAEAKSKGRKILTQSGVVFVFLLVVNGIIVSYYANKEKPIIATAPIGINYLSDYPASAPLEIEFDIAGAPEASSARFVAWDFGDGGKGAGQQVKHTFDKLGEYEVTAKLTMQDNSEVVYTEYVPVFNVLPKIKLDTSDLAGGAPLKVKLDASKSTDSNGDVVGYQWIFPDGTVSAESKVEHVFEDEGEYEVELKVIDDIGEASRQMIKVSVAGEGIPQAVISTEPDPAEGHVPLRIKFLSTESTDNDGSIVKYEWDFGDGSPVENGQSAVHVFDKVGNYKVKLTVWDNDNMFDTALIDVDALKGLVKPTAVISFVNNKKEGAAPFKISVDGGNSEDEDGSVVAYSWDFGDGSDAEEGQRVEHEYTRVGEYELTLTVTDDDGLVAVKKETIKVKKPEPQSPVVVLAVSPIPPTVGVNEEVYFDASQSYDPDGNIISYEWDFGDGSMVRLGPAKVRHKYKNADIYTIKVKAYDNSGRTSETQVKVAVHESNLAARISADKTEGQVPLVIQFEAVGEATISSYEWDFGDGLTSGSRDPLHIFTEPGDYTVSLTTTDAAGTVSEDTMIIIVEPRE